MCQDGAPPGGPQGAQSFVPTLVTAHSPGPTGCTDPHPGTAQGEPCPVWVTVTTWVTAAYLPGGESGLDCAPGWERLCPESPCPKRAAPGHRHAEWPHQ